MQSMYFESSAPMLLIGEGDVKRNNAGIKDGKGYLGIKESIEVVGFSGTRRVGV